MVIEVKYYKLDGEIDEYKTYTSCNDAFTDMLRRNQHALAHPIHTTAGAYNYHPQQDGHTLSLFVKIMECCCNTPELYSLNLREAGIA